MMHDSNLQAPDDEELLAYLSGEEELAEEKLRHLALCSSCQRRLKAYKRTDDVLLAQLYRTLCPDPTRLLLYSANALAAPEAAMLAMHLQECLLCTDELSAIRAEQAAFTPFPEPELPAYQYFIDQALQLLLAQPVAQQAELALRQQAASSPWPRRYIGGEFSLSLQILHTEGESVKLIGFFDGFTLEQLQTLQGIVVDLYATPAPAPQDSPEQPLASTVMDDLGNFAFAEVQPGSYLLIIHLPAAEFVVEELALP